MSDETKAALESAIEAHFASELPNCHASQWVLQIFGQNIEDHNAYYLREWPDNQPVHYTQGLIDYADSGHREYISRSSVDEEDDDD